MEVRIDNRILLTPVMPSFAGDIFQSFDEEIIRFLAVEDPPKKIADTEKFIRTSMEQAEKGTDHVWVILADHEFVGCCGLHSIMGRQPHFGIWIKQSAQGMGTGKKVVQFMLPWIVRKFDVDFVKYPVDHRNERSIKLIKGLPMIKSDHYRMGEKKILSVFEYRLYP